MALNRKRKASPKTRLETDRKEAAIDANRQHKDEASIMAHLRSTYSGFNSFWRPNYVLRARNVFDNAYRLNIWAKQEYCYRLVYSSFIRWDSDGVSYSNPDLNERFNDGPST